MQNLSPPFQCASCHLAGGRTALGHERLPVLAGGVQFQRKRLFSLHFDLGQSGKAECQRETPKGQPGGSYCYEANNSSKCLLLSERERRGDPGGSGRQEAHRGGPFWGDLGYRRWRVIPTFIPGEAEPQGFPAAYLFAQ